MRIALALATILGLAAAVPAARQLFSSSGKDDIVCSDTTATAPKCMICIDKTWNQAACEGINQINCHKRSINGKDACLSGDNKCSWYAEKNTCNDVNSQNCPGAGENLYSCVDYYTGGWKSTAACDTRREACEDCLKGDCFGPAPPPPRPPPPTPPTPPTPTPTPTPTGKTCDWESEDLACTGDQTCTGWANANCSPSQGVTGYCKSNGFCHFSGGAPAPPTPPTPKPPTPPTPPPPPPPSSKCDWQTETLACTADEDCTVWANSHCEESQGVTGYCKSNKFCHFSGASFMFTQEELPYVQ
jgi:hypothetical protein